MNDTTNDAVSLQGRTRRNTIRLAWWTGAWLVTILVNVAAGIGMIVANKQHLDGLDELQRKIQLEAMAIALGVGLVAGLAYSTLDVANVIAGDAEISFLVILISLTYIGGVLIGRRKYA